MRCVINHHDDEDDTWVKATSSFSTWLETRDGGRKKAAGQHASQVSMIFEMIEESKLKNSSIWSQPQIKIFTEDYAVEKCFQPATINSYLRSLKLWYTYILSQEANRLLAETKRHIGNVKSRVSNWIASYNGESTLAKF